MDANYINAFLSATANVISTMAFTNCVGGEPYIKDDATAKGDVSGIVGISGAAEGSLCISFAEVCICKIVSNMFGEEFAELNDEIKDAVGEITNMISGDARRALAEKGVVLTGAVPSVVSGKDHAIKHMSKAPVIAIPFDTEAGDFTVEISFNS